MASSLVQIGYGADPSAGAFARARPGRGGRAMVEDVVVNADPSAGPAWGRAIEQARRDQDNGRALLGCAAPALASFVRPLEAPFASVKKARAVFPSLLDVQLPFPLERCVYRFVGARIVDGGGVRADAVAIPADRLQQCLDAFAAAGLDPEWIGQEAMVLWRHAKDTLPPLSDRPRVVLYLGRDRTVAVFGRGDRLQSAFATRAAWNGEHDPASADKLARSLLQQVSGVEGLSDGPAPAYLVCGPGAEDAGGLRARLGVASDHWTVVERAAGFLARALAAGVVDPAGDDLNLRAGALAHPRLLRLADRARMRIFAATLAASIVLAATALTASEAIRREHERRQRLIREEAAALTGLSVIPRGQEVFIARQQLAEAGQAFQVFNEWADPGALPVFRDLLAGAHRSGMTLETLAVRPSSLLVAGTCADWNDPDALAAAYRDLGWKTEIERRDAGNDERVHFTLRAQP